MRYDKEILQKIAAKLNFRFPVAQFSEDLGYSKSTVSNYLNGQKPISEKFIRSLENHYKFKYIDFLDANKTVIMPALTMEKVKEIAVFVAENQERLMSDPLFRAVIESIFLRREIQALKGDDPDETV